MIKKVHPEGWEPCQISDVAQLVRGVTYAKSDAVKAPNEGFRALLRANNIDETINHDELVFVRAARVSPEQMLRSGDVLIAMSSGSKHLVGKAAQLRRVNGETFGAFCGAVRPSSEINPAFFGWFSKLAPIARQFLPKPRAPISTT